MKIYSNIRFLRGLHVYLKMSQQQHMSLFIYLMAAVQPIIAIEMILMQIFLYCYAGDLLSSKIMMLSQS